MPGDRAERLLKVARSPRGIRKFERAPSTVGERNGHAVLVPELTEQLRRLGRVLDARVEVAGPPSEKGEVHGDERHDHAVPGHSRSLSNCREPPASFVEVPAISGMQGRRIHRSQHLVLVPLLLGDSEPFGHQCVRACPVLLSVRRAGRCKVQHRHPCSGRRRPPLERECVPGVLFLVEAASAPVILERSGQAKPDLVFARVARPLERRPQVAQLVVDACVHNRQIARPRLTLRICRFGKIEDMQGMAPA